MHAPYAPHTQMHLNHTHTPAYTHTHTDVPAPHTYRPRVRQPYQTITRSAARTNRKFVILGIPNRVGKIRLPSMPFPLQNSCSENHALIHIHVVKIQSTLYLMPLPPKILMGVKIIEYTS